MPSMPHVVRLFFALWPAATTRNQLIKQAQQLGNDCPGRRIRPENLHLTLIFIGETNQSNVPKICQAVSTIHQPSFSLSLDKIYFWKKAGVVVAGASQYPTALAMFVENLQHLLTALAIHYDDTHVFTPHVTLFRNVRHCKLPASIEPIDWSVTHWSLVQSRQTTYGSVYQSIADWPLES